MNDKDSSNQGAAIAGLIILIAVVFFLVGRSG